MTVAKNFCSIEYFYQRKGKIAHKTGAEKSTGDMKTCLRISMNQIQETLPLTLKQ